MANVLESYCSIKLNTNKSKDWIEGDKSNTLIFCGSLTFGCTKHRISYLYRTDELEFDSNPSFSGYRPGNVKVVKYFNDFW